MANKIDILDFNMFFDIMKSAAKLLNSAKLMFSPTGLAIYGARDDVARCELTTNAISSSETFDFCIDSIASFNKLLSTIKDVHENDFSDLELSYSRPNVLAKSKKMKLKLPTSKESIIEKWISTKIETKMSKVFEFKTNVDLVKRINAHAFMFNDTNSVKIYLETKDDMEANSLFATIGNKSIDINKELTLKFGFVTYGSIPEGRSIVIDFERMNLFNCTSANEITISLMDKNVLMSEMVSSNKNGAYSNIKIYCSLMKG